MQSELNQIYDDLLYWRTPVQYIGDYIDIFSPTKSVINNAKGNLEGESIDAAKTVSTENNKDTTVEDCKSVLQALGKYTDIISQDNDTGIDLSPQDLTDSLSDQYQSAKERDFSTFEEKKDIKPDESYSQIKRDGVQIDGGDENQFLNASRTSEKGLDHAAEEVDSGLKEDTSSIPVFEAVDVNSNYSNNNNNNNNSAESDAYSDLDSTPTSQSDDSLDEGSNVKFSGSRLFAFTYTSSNLFTSAVQRKRRLVRLGVMGNSNTHHHVKQSSKKEKVSRRRSQKSTTTSQPEKLSTPSSGLKTRKRQHNDNSSVGSRLSGQYDNISVLSSHDVLSTASRKEKDLGSVEKVKSPRLTGSSLSTSDDSTSANKSLQDLLAYKPSLKTEFDFRKMGVPEPTEKQAVEDQEITSRGQDLRDGEEATENVSDSTLLTLKGVCCAISSLQEKLLTDSNDKSPDRLLLANKYTGRRHPSISPSYPILSTRTPMSPAQSPFNSPGSRSPAEPNSPAEIRRASLQRKINQERTISTNVTSTQPCSTVNELNCDATMTSSDKNTTTVSALKDILSSNEGFSGSLLNSWLLGNSSDEDTEKFIEEFCDLLLRSGLLVVMPKEELKPHEKGTTTTDSKTLFNRLKFVPSQIYTWGPFSRIASNSPHKTSTYRDYRVRQVEVSPTVASTTKSGKKDGRFANGGEDAPAATPKSSPEKLSRSKSVSPRTVESCDSSFSAASTSFSSSLPSHSGSGDSVSDNKTQTLILESNPTSPTSTNSSKKLGNVWPPPRPEEDDAHKQKYTEAEHQHEMMVMKRNHTEELYKITKDYETNIYEMNEEHTQDIESMQQEANLMRQEIAYLKAKLNADKQDASTQTQNVAQLRMSKGIQVDFAGDLFSPPPQITLPTIDENATVPSAPPPPPIPGAIPPPPPPPPPMGGVPPPPPIGGPPPAPGFPSSKGDSPRRAPIEPKKPMKPLYWKRIQISKKELKNNKSVWIHIEDVPINVDEMEQIFCKTTTTKKAKALSETITEKKKIAPAKIFDSKRSQAVGIFLSSLHTEMKDIRDAILNLDTSIVDEENMKSIFDLKATKEELDSIQAHLKSQDKKKEEERQPLDKPEQFLHDLAKIECFEDRLFCITFRTAFSEDIQSLQKELSHINNALQELQDKHTVLRVLGLILSMGNYLNGGNRTRGQADGFQLEILSKLKDMKGLRPDNTTFTLLNYIAWAYMRRYDLDVSYEVRSCPVPTFQSIILASQVNFTDIAKDLKRVRKELKECSKKVSEVIKSSVERIQPFKDIMEQFVEQAYATVEELDNDLKSTQESFKDAVDFFCVKSKSGSSKSIEPKEFFTHWQTFCMDFHATWKVEMKRLVKEEQQKLKKNIEESREKQATTTVVTTVRRRPNSLRTRLNQPRRRRKDGGSSTGNTT